MVNILLLGVDNRSVELVRGRADANIICSINTQDGSIKLTSIARDTAVEVPGYKSKKRLNTAFKFGSKDGDIAKGAEPVSYPHLDVYKRQRQRRRRCRPKG